MNFANVTDWTIPEGDVDLVKDSLNRIIWKKTVEPGPNPDPDNNVPFYVKNEYSISYDINFLQTTSSSITIEYSYDNSTWQTLGTTVRNTPLYITIPANSQVYFRANTNYWNTNKIEGAKFVGGNIMSLIYGANWTGKTVYPSSSTFQSLFEDTDLIFSHKLSLPATSVNQNDYASMFNGCTKLRSVPSLPATTLATECYGWMFANCTSLINAPSLPATTLATGCYRYMFYRCDRLLNAPSLPATTLKNNCYEFMFQYCISLENAPSLPATTLTGGCYFSMFNNCTSLKTMNCLATTNIATGSTTGNTSYPKTAWMYNTPATGTFTIKRNTINSWPRNDFGIPSGWTVVEV